MARQQHGLSREVEMSSDEKRGYHPIGARMYHDTVLIDRISCVNTSLQSHNPRLGRIPTKTTREFHDFADLLAPWFTGRRRQFFSQFRQTAISRLSSTISFELPPAWKFCVRFVVSW
jgi:hypothetical protein